MVKNHNKMKTLILIISIFVVSHRKQIKLTSADIVYLNANGTNYLKGTLLNFKSGGTIRNNEAAEQIFILLHK